MQCDEQHIQGCRLLRGRDGFTLQLEPAELSPAHAVQTGPRAEVSQGHQQSIAMLVLDGLEVHLAQVLGTQHALQKAQQRSAAGKDSWAEPQTAAGSWRYLKLGYRLQHFEASLQSTGAGGLGWAETLLQPGYLLPQGGQLGAAGCTKHTVSQY